MGLNWFIPALVKRRVGSERGAQGEETTGVWDLVLVKKSTKVDRTLLVVHSGGCCSLVLLSVDDAESVVNGVRVGTVGPVSSDGWRLRSARF